MRKPVFGVCFWLFLDYFDFDVRKRVFGVCDHAMLKAAKSVTFDLLISKIMFLFFKNTVKKLKFRNTFYQFRKS